MSCLRLGWREDPPGLAGVDVFHVQKHRNTEHLNIFARPLPCQWEAQFFGFVTSSDRVSVLEALQLDTHLQYS